MLRKIALSFLILLHLPAFSQVCGGSFNVINFYVLNGSKVDSIHYEVLPYTSKDLAFIFSKSLIDKAIQTRMLNNIHNGIYLSEPFINSNSIPELQPYKNFYDAIKNKEVARILNDGIKSHGMDSVKLKGTVSNGTLIFPTLELNTKLYFLKITYNNHIGLYIVDLFGGCGKELNLIYNKYSFVEAAEAFWRYAR